MTIKQILVKYWGFTSFRPFQEDVINSILAAKDTLALLPTGGGKSLCFQVPALSKSGICIVVTPLIALMKDQVENLKKRGIKALAIHSGMHPNEIEIHLNNCIYENIKFLYVSPERLENIRFIESIKKMNVNLLAVDEAHCISQWGYNFRPPYLRIAQLRQYIPETPVLALTATAIKEVVIDIQEKLNFKSKNVFRSSFERKNLIYYVAKEEDKLQRILKIASNLNGSGIIYARTRRATKEISSFLIKNKIKSDYYHAGIDQQTRDKKQASWTSGRTRIIVATNAFGMGIDKADVRFVIHIDLPDCPEKYFQEAGRAGRDGKKSYAILLYENSDIIDAKKYFQFAFPEIKFIKAVYQALGNYFQLAVGAGKNTSFEFDISKFCQNYNFPLPITYNSLKFLEKEGYLLLNETINSHSKIHFRINKMDLYKFQVENKNYDNFLKTLLRSYSGLFTDFVSIYESEISRHTGLSIEEVITYFLRLQKFDILTYISRKTKPQIIYCYERIDSKDIYISSENYEIRKVEAAKRLDFMIDYAESTNKCRSQLLLSYFDETDVKRCGKCDVCIERNKVELSEFEFSNIVDFIKPGLIFNPLSIAEIIDINPKIPENKIIKVVQWLEDNNKIIKNSENKYRWL
ncbi:MAG: RecQ family ATP-dependent DNA helicase [Bacteroidales bacterium]|nr:RecQ family ATP-dependent DNA helicase [Bacteroidales bacterium]